VLSTKETKLVASYMEVKYPLNMSVLNVYGDFQKQYEIQYPEINYEEGKLSLSTVKEHGEPNTVYTTPLNTGLMIHGIEDKSIFIKSATELIKFASDKLGLNTFDRLGVRLNYVLPSVSLTEDTKEVLEKMLSKNAVRQVGETISGFDFKIVAETSEFKYRLALTFVKRSTSDESLPEQGLLADIDCSKESISIDDGIKFIENIQRSSLQKVTDILNNFLVRRDR
jgi:hypothetical protein